MALKVWDGFDHYNQASDLNARSGFLQYSGSGSLLSGAGRNGNGKAWNGSLTATFGQRVASAFVGISAIMGTSDVTFTFTDTVANAIQVTVVFRSRNYTVEIWRGNQSTLLYRSTNNAWGGNSTNFIEIWPVIDGSAGSVTVHWNQVQIAAVTGVNTLASTNAWWDQATFSGAAWDDLYYCDTTTGLGSNPCNTFLGDPRVYTLFPTANAAVQFTPKTGSNWQDVSEIAMDGDTSYNASATAGNEDLFALGSLPGTISGILGLQITGAYRKDDAGLRKIKQALKSSVTEVYGASNSLSDTSYVYFTDQWILDPSGSVAWTQTSLNAINAGYNVAA